MLVSYVLLYVDTDGRIQVKPAQIVADLRVPPAPTSVFVGREKPVSRVIACVIHDTRLRRIFVLHGLGGSGKTQIALRVVEITQDEWTEVLFIDASSSETTISSLRGFAVAKKIGDKHTGTLQWLTTQTGRWLLIFDNADDPTVGIEAYFPKCSHGDILVTTRYRDLVLLARGPDSDYHVSGMSPEEALELPFRTAHTQHDELSEAEKAVAGVLVRVSVDFCHFP